MRAASDGAGNQWWTASRVPYGIGIRIRGDPLHPVLHRSLLNRRHRHDLIQQNLVLLNIIFDFDTDPDFSAMNTDPPIQFRLESPFSGP